MGNSPGGLSSTFLQNNSTPNSIDQPHSTANSTTNFEEREPQSNRTGVSFESNRSSTHSSSNRMQVDSFEPNFESTRKDQPGKSSHHGLPRPGLASSILGKSQPEIKAHQLAPSSGLGILANSSANVFHDTSMPNVSQLDINTGSADTHMSPEKTDRKPAVRRLPDQTKRSLFGGQPPS